MRSIDELSRRGDEDDSGKPTGPPPNPPTTGG